MEPYQNETPHSWGWNRSWFSGHPQNNHQQQQQNHAHQQAPFTAHHQPSFHFSQPSTGQGSGDEMDVDDDEVGFEPVAFEESPHMTQRKKRKLDRTDMSEISLEQHALSAKKAKQLELEPLDTSVSFTVKTLSGRVIHLKIDRNDLVLRIKEQLESLQGVPAKDMRLIYKGRNMADYQTVEHYGISNGDTVMMATAMVGGGLQ